jgi:hypothetical protein
LAETSLSLIAQRAKWDLFGMGRQVRVFWTRSVPINFGSLSYQDDPRRSRATASYAKSKFKGQNAKFV